MSWKQVVGAIINTLFRLSVSCLVVIGVYRLAMYSYHFGYMVFNDAAKEITPGRDITISVEMDDSVMDLGKTLEVRGLVEDGRIFFVQERLSEYHGQIQPGIYTLNTSMKPSELIAAMAKKDEDADIDADLLENAQENMLPMSETEGADFEGMPDGQIYDESGEGSDVTEEGSGEMPDAAPAENEGAPEGNAGDDDPLRAGAGL